MNLALIDIKNHIAKITINRPEVLNAMSSDLISELIKTFNSLIQDDTVGIIIITGSGDKSFIAGADIKAMQKMNESDALEFGRSGQELTKICLLYTSPSPRDIR